MLPESDIFGCLASLLSFNDYVSISTNVDYSPAMCHTAGWRLKTGTGSSSCGSQSLFGELGAENLQQCKTCGQTLLSKFYRVEKFNCHKISSWLFRSIVEEVETQRV